MKTLPRWLLLAIGAMAILPPVAGSQTASHDRMNVLLIMCDDLNDYPTTFGGWPRAITPNIDRLARSSVIFENAHSNAPICAPERASLFTGVYPHNSGNYGFVHWKKNPVLAKSKTLIRYFRENGYVALGSGKLLHHNVVDEWTEYGVRQYFGPMPYDGKKAVPHPSVPVEYSSQGLLDGTFVSLADVPSIPATADAPGYEGWWDDQRKRPFRYVNDDDRDLMRDEEIAAWAERRLGKIATEERGQPFFMAVGFARPHTPLIAPRKYFDLYPLESVELPVILPGDAEDCHYEENFPATHKGPRFFRALKAAFPSLEEGLKRYVRAYLACVSFVDVQVGRVLDALEANGLSESTIVVFTSDHGYNHGQKDYLFKNSLWEESTRVPLLIRVPDAMGGWGARVAHPVSLIDIYPTLVDLCELQGETRVDEGGHSLDGHSLRPFIEDPGARHWDGPDVALSVIGGVHGAAVKDQHFAVRSLNWRYALYANGAEELYHHVSDPHEWHNLALDPKYAEIRRRLQKEMFALVPGLETP